MNGVDGNWWVGGTFSCNTLNIPDATVVNAAVSTTADIDASKLEQHHARGFGQVGTSASETKVIHTVRGATARIKKFAVTNISACAGASTIDVDLKKNGTTVLSAVIELNSTTPTARSIKEGTLSVTTAVAGDVFEVVITISQSGTDALSSGVYAEMRLDEDYPQ
jgi:hypothetical protein